MPDETSGGIRRVSRKDRKKKLDPRGPLFPPEEDFAPVEAESEAEPEPESPPPSPKVSAPLEDRFPPLDVAEPPPSAVVKPVARKPGSTLLPNLVAIVFAFGTVAILIIYAIIAIDPYTPLNPLPPFTPFPIIITATSLPPTATPPPAAASTATFTPIPASELRPDSPFPFVMAESGVVYVPNVGEKGCNWLSIAGSVTDTTGQPAAGLGVRVVGDNLDETVGTGGALNYGPGGFEMPLGDVPREAVFTVQLLSIQGAPLSEAYTVATHAACDQNVAIISFVQVRGF